MPCWHLLRQAAPANLPRWKHVLTADISLLPSSVGSTGDLAKRANTEAAMEVSTTVSTGTPSEAPMEGTVIDQKEKDHA